MGDTDQNNTFFFGVKFPRWLNHPERLVQLVAVDKVGVDNEETRVFLFVGFTIYSLNI